MTNEAAENTRRSWDVATRNHNAHKGDQAAWFRGGGVARVLRPGGGTT